MDAQLNQFKQKFIDEAAKLIEDLEGDLMQLEKLPDSKELIESVFRCMHTIKGTSSMYGFDNIAEITHQLENIYDLVRYNELAISSSIIDITLVAADYIKNLLNQNDVLSDTNKQVKIKIVQSIEKILNTSNIVDAKKIVKQKKKQTESGAATWQIIFIPEESIITRCINLIITFRDLFSLGSYEVVQNILFEESGKFTIFLYTDKTRDDVEDALIFIMDYCKISKIADFDIFDEEAIEKHINSTRNLELEDKETTGPEAEASLVNQHINIDNELLKGSNVVKSRIGVESAKLDELMYLVSELITTNSQLAMASKNPVYKPLDSLFEKIDKLSKQFRNNTLSLRLVPLSDMIIRMQRLVRDLSNKLGKEVQLVTQGTEIELDKNTIDALAEPLMHLIRNCIDHGIEAPESREEKGKPRKGVLKINTYHSGNFVYIQVMDDGKGIDPEFIRSKALKMGLISESAQSSKNELYDLIFKPGFSTAESLTEVSGRGVGMDIVKKRIADLRGSIEISSEINQGTTFTIKLQQTIAILDTMLFRLHDLYFLVPLTDVEECRLLDRNELEDRKNTNTIEYAGRLIPYIDLYELFDMNSSSKSKKAKLIVVNHQEEIFAIPTDGIVGEHQAVLKSLGDAAKKQPYFAFASMLGDGNLAYLLDLNAVQKILTLK